MKGITAFEALTDIRGDYILDAEIDTVRLAMPLPKKERSPSPFSRFINSGWGVAIVCALVAVSVMGGILWAGLNLKGPFGPSPVGALPSEDTATDKTPSETVNLPFPPTAPESEALESMLSNTVYFISYGDASFQSVAQALQHTLGGGIALCGPGEDVPGIDGSLWIKKISEEVVGTHGYIIERSESTVTIKAATPKGAERGMIALRVGTICSEEESGLIFFRAGFLPEDGVLKIVSYE